MARGVKSEIPIDTFSKVVEAIYDCALDVTRWRETLKRIVELLRSQNCSLEVYNLENHSADMTFQVGIDERYQRLYETKYAAMDPHHAPLHFVPVGRVVTSAMLVPAHELLESRFYRELLKPQGLRDAIGLKLLRTERRMGMLAASRRESQGLYGEAEIQLLGLLAPHICRSVTISDVLNLKTIRSEALEATLNALTTGVYLADQFGRIIYMNRAAERQIDSGNVLRIENNRLVTFDRMVRGALATAIDEASGDEATMPASGFSLALPGRDGAGLVATILPLARGERRNICGAFAATVAIFVQDPVVVPPFPGEAFAKLYGLTGSELRVLLAMAPGLSVKEAAEMLGIGETTAKTHLQHIYDKTGTAKQTELLHLFIRSSPPVGTA
jgi:DNA-binding CsgD family transcriptional regulator/PAS domain-containing protein